MANQKLTVRDIAADCGVSIATVSRVINGTGRISAETRRQVMDAIDRLGYIPNASAKTLRTGTSRLVGIFVTELTYEMSTSTVTILQEYLREKGYDSIICNIGTSAEREEYYYHLMLSLNVCGIMLLSLRSSSSLYKMTRLPIVCLYKNPLTSFNNSHVCLIETDDFGAGRIAADELIERGSTRLAEVRIMSLDSRIPLGRHLGFLQSLYEHNLAYDEGLSIVSQSTSYGEIYDTVTAALDAGKVADGYFCSSDLIALALIHSLEDHHLKIPEDVRVVGCNDMTLARYHRGITTIRHQMDAICSAAVDALGKLLSGDPLSPSELRQTFPVSLVRRETT